MPDPVRLTAPFIFNHNSFEYFLNQLPAENIKDTVIVLDLSLLSNITPYTLLNFLILCNYLKSLSVTVEIDFCENLKMLSYFKEWGFFGYTDALLRNSGSQQSPQLLQEEYRDILVKVMPVRQENDIYEVIGLLRENLNFSADKSTDLAVVISEISQNILEHSDSSGFVAITGRADKKNRQMLNICIADDGIGMSVSLKEKLAYFDKRYLDGIAIYKAFFEGISRYNDLGRGNGIIKTKGIIEKHKGKMSLRSGKAKVWGNIAAWQIERVLRKRLRYMPGTQVNIAFPL
ncbi:MAG: hypothetical protein GF375_01500 [Candidatus Omnitrophica bacterium]|nr:hypothetical protein [Candidatus Omnitrophota bacterium]